MCNPIKCIFYISAGNHDEKGKKEVVLISCLRYAPIAKEEARVPELLSLWGYKLLHMLKDSNKCLCNQTQQDWQSMRKALPFQDQRNHEPVWLQAEMRIMGWGLPQHCPPGSHFSLKVFSWFYCWWKSIFHEIRKDLLKQPSANTEDALLNRKLKYYLHIKEIKFAWEICFHVKLIPKPISFNIHSSML